MKLFNIINESKSFILILLFTFTLVITSQSFATGVATPDPVATPEPTPEAKLNELCKVQDLTTLKAANKEKCVGWCQIKTNWSEKCAKIDVENPVDVAAGAGAGETLKTRIIKALNSLDDIATGLKVPDSYNNVYSFKIKLDQSQRPTLFEHMKPKEPSTDAEAIDKTLVSDTMKEIILDGLGYSDFGFILKADGTNNDNDKLEKFFIAFRNKWLQFEAKGSITDSDKDFEPSAFKALASSNQGNHGPMHQIYNMLEDGQKVFSANKYDSVINDSSEVATDLKNLRDAIVGFVKSAVVVTVPDKWAPNTDLEFSIKLGTLRASLETFLDGLDATFDVTKKEDFDKIKHYLTPMDLYTSANVPQDRAKEMAGNGLLVLSGGDFKYELDPEKVADAVAGGAAVNVNETMNFTDAEKNTQEYKIYAARLKAFEAGLKERFASGIDYGRPENDSLLHKITELARNNRTRPAAENSHFTVTISTNIAFNGSAGGWAGDIGVPHKVGFVGGKWVVLIYANTAARRFQVGQKTFIEFITEAPAAGTPPRFTVQAPSTYVSATFWGTGPNRDNPEHHTFDALSGNGLAVGTNLFTPEKLLTNAIVRTGRNDNLDDAVPANPNNFPLKLMKFRVINTHNLGHRVTDQGNFQDLLLNLNYRAHFITDNTFGTDTDKVFADLTKFSAALGQLYAFNQFIAAIDFNHVIVAGDNALVLPADGDVANARHYLSSHVLDPSTNAPNDVTFVLTCKFMRNR